jgi:hypothetical protein
MEVVLICQNSRRSDNLIPSVETHLNGELAVFAGAMAVAGIQTPNAYYVKKLGPV